MPCNDFFVLLCYVFNMLYTVNCPTAEMCYTNNLDLIYTIQQLSLDLENNQFFTLEFLEYYSCGL